MPGLISIYLKQKALDKTSFSSLNENKCGTRISGKYDKKERKRKKIFILYLFWDFM